MMSVDVSILVVPREQFGKTRRTLESLYANTAIPFKLVYVDGNSPRRVARYLKAESIRRNFTLIRTERYLAANEARNIGLAHVDSEYVVFLDNDVEVTAGWLEALIRCAEETGAGAVGPMYYLGDPKDGIIHTLGAEMRIADERGERRYFEAHQHVNRRADDIRPQLVRREIDLIEFHCALARTDVVRRIGALDEQLLSFLDHNDFCLAVRQAGATIFSEPRAIVAHLSPPPLEPSDMPYFILRWSNAWIDASISRFSQKYGLRADDPGLQGHYRYRDGHRRRLFAGVRKVVLKTLGNPGLELVNHADRLLFDRILERTLVPRSYAKTRSIRNQAC